MLGKQTWNGAAVALECNELSTYMQGEAGRPCTLCIQSFSTSLIGREVVKKTKEAVSSDAETGGQCVSGGRFNADVNENFHFTNQIIIFRSELRIPWLARNANSATESVT